MLVLHILIALTTIGVSGFTLIKPSRNKLKSSYVLTFLTFATGSYLIVMSPAHLVSACITGIVFLGVVGSMLFAARYRLSSLPAKD